MREWRYIVSNKYGFNTRIRRCDEIDAYRNPHGALINVPQHMPPGDLDRLCAKLGACGVTHFDAIYNTDKYPVGQFAFSNLMDYIYPCVRKHGVDVFTGRKRYEERCYHTNHARNPYGGVPVQVMAVSTPSSRDYDAKPYIDKITNILKEKPMSDAPKYDDQTGELLPTEPVYIPSIKFGGDLTPGEAYKLEVVGGKNPPAVAAPGTLVVALGDSEGYYTGWVRLDDGTERTFETDDSDLYTEA